MSYIMWIWFWIISTILAYLWVGNVAIFLIGAIILALTLLLKGSVEAIIKGDISGS